MVCDRGTVRKENQDAAFLRLATTEIRQPGELLPGGVVTLPAPDSAATTPFLTAMVADGMGGPPGGAQASQIILGTVARKLSAAGEIGDAPRFLRRLFGNCDEAVLAEAERHGLHGMGSTCTVLMLFGAQLHLGHVGDSRCYRMRPAQAALEQLSQDHNVAAHLVDEGVLTPEEARNHRASHALTQAVGLGKPLDPQIAHWPAPVADEIFLLCSDGLLRVVEEAEILQAFLEDPAAGPAGKTGLQVTAERLLDLANRRSSPDNVSIVALRWCFDD